MTRRIAGPARFLAALAVLALAATAVRAEGAEDPCARDVDRFCSNRAPVDVLSCLQSHRADLVPACQDLVETALVRVQVLIQDCEPDAFEFCRNAGRGEPTAMCLAASQGRLSRRCQEHLDGFARAEKASAAACAQDASTLCPGVKTGKGEAWLCLLFRGKDVSPSCRKALVP